MNIGTKFQNIQNIQQIKLKLRGMSCAACASTVEKAIVASDITLISGELQGIVTAI